MRVSRGEFGEFAKANAELCPEDVPRRGSRWSAIWRFALTFDGYAYCGSFERCAKIANCRAARNLTELRICLFFEQRRYHHCGINPRGRASLYVRGLVDDIREKVLRGEIE